jgi:L-aminopeptidase/D-esterase-like protein
MDGEFGGLGPDPAGGYTAPDPSHKERAMGLHASIGANTTIAIVATDATLTKTQCHRLAVNAHDGMARAIVPSHTPLDGDLVFGVSTGTGAPVDHAAYAPIGAAAATCLSRAIARAVFEATPAQSDLIATYR